MPSIRKRLKKLTSSKKSKSTSDLDKIKEPEGQPVEDDDTRSYASEAISEMTDISLNESTYSYASKDEEGKKKKKRRLKLSLTKKNKKESPVGPKLVRDPSGNVVFRSLSIEHDPRGGANMSNDDSLLKPENVELSKSVGSNVGRDDSSEADDWRMSGLLETVNRSSNPSLNDNLISAFEERRQTLLQKANAESTPIKENFTPETATSLEGEEAVDKDIKTKVYMIPSHTVEVSFTNRKTRTGSDEDTETKYQGDRQLVSENWSGGSDDDDNLLPIRRDLEPVEEEDFTEMRNVDPECEIGLDGPLNEEKEEVTVLSEECSNEIISKKSDRLVQVMDERSVICDTGHGKKVIIRHLEEVVNNANMELSKNVNMEDWLVLNIEKDDWVVVGYSKVGGEITNLFEQSVDTI